MVGDYKFGNSKHLEDAKLLITILSNLKESIKQIKEEEQSSPPLLEVSYSAAVQDTHEQYEIPIVLEAKIYCQESQLYFKRQF